MPKDETNIANDALNLVRTVAEAGAEVFKSKVSEILDQTPTGNSAGKRSTELAIAWGKQDIDEAVRKLLGLPND